MNELKDVPPHVLNPPAIVQAAFDEERALTECRALIGRRDKAKGDFKDAILALGQKLIEARRAMPGEKCGQHEKYSAEFCAFVQKCGLAANTATMYMSFARDPRRLKAKRAANSVPFYSRRRTLEEVLELLRNAPDIKTAIAVVQEELHEIK